MKLVILALIVSFSFCGNVIAGDCANGKCHLNKRYSQSNVSSSTVVRINRGPVVRNHTPAINRKVVRSSH